jgi:hypothetical protein
MPISAAAGKACGRPVGRRSVLGWSRRTCPGHRCGSPGAGGHARRPGIGLRPRDAVVCGRAPARQGHGFAATVTELALLLVVEAGAGMMGEGSHEGPAADHRTCRPSAGTGGAAAAGGGGRPALRWRGLAHQVGCPHPAGPRVRSGGTACPRHRSPAHPRGPSPASTVLGCSKPCDAARATWSVWTGRPGSAIWRTCAHGFAAAKLDAARLAAGAAHDRSW